MSKIEITAATSNDLARAIVRYTRSPDFLEDSMRDRTSQLVPHFAVGRTGDGKVFVTFAIDGKCFHLEPDHSAAEGLLEPYKPTTEAADGSQA